MAKHTHFWPPPKYKPDQKVMWMDPNTGATVIAEINWIHDRYSTYAHDDSEDRYSYQLKYSRQTGSLFDHPWVDEANLKPLTELAKLIYD